MKKTTALYAIIALGTFGCSNLNPDENKKLFGDITGGLTSAAMSAAGVRSSYARPLANSAREAAGNTAYNISKYQASRAQSKLAEQRARQYYANLSSSKKETLKKNKVRYLSVETKSDDRMDGKKAIMVFDTRSENLVGNTVYAMDKDKAPEKGEEFKFDTHSTEYVGRGT